MIKTESEKEEDYQKRDKIGNNGDTRQYKKVGGVKMKESVGGKK